LVSHAAILQRPRTIGSYCRVVYAKNEKLQYVVGCLPVNLGMFSASSELLRAFCNAAPLFSILYELFMQKHRRWGWHIIFLPSQGCKFACLSSVPVQSTLIPTHLRSELTCQSTNY
jgi:hypothetical protein